MNLSGIFKAEKKKEKIFFPNIELFLFSDIFIYRCTEKVI